MLSLCVIKHNEAKFYLLLTSTPYGTSRPGQLPRGKGTPVPIALECWVGSRDGLDSVVKAETPVPAWNQPRTSSLQPCYDII
jgi:hypothetical protein